MGQVLVLLTGDTSCYIQGLLSAIYALVRMQHGKVTFLLIVIGDRKLVRELEDVLVPGHGEGALWILNYLDIHEMIMMYQESALEVRH